MIKNIHCPSCRVPVSFVRFSWAWIFSTDFLKYSNIKFHENPSSGSRGVPCRQINWRTDRNDEAVVAFRNFAFAPKKCSRYFLVKLCSIPWTVLQREAKFYCQSTVTFVRRIYLHYEFSPLCFNLKGFLKGCHFVSVEASSRKWIISEQYCAVLWPRTLWYSGLCDCHAGTARSL